MNDPKGNDQATDVTRRSDRELVITRRFNAPARPCLTRGASPNF